MAVALAAADTYVVVLALEQMMSGVGLGIDALQRATPIISGFLLGYIAVLPLIGRLSDLVSRQRVLLGCLAIFVIGSAATALAVELPVLVGGRVLQGIGGGGLVPATLALVAQLWPAGERGTPLGVVGAVQEIGSVLGPLLGAAVLAVWDWRMIFWLNAIAGIVLGAMVLVLGRGAGHPGSAADTEPTGAGEPGEGVRLPRPRLWKAATAVAGVATLLLLGLALWAPERLTQDITLGEPFVPYAGHTSRLFTQIGLWGAIALVVTVLLAAPLVWPVLRRIDLVGALLVTVALGCLVLTFASADPEKQVIGPLGWTLLPVAAVAAGLYLVRHRAAAQPLIARGVVRRRVRPALVASALVGVALVAVVVDVPILARLTVTEDQTQAALILVRFLVAVPIGALAGGWLLRRVGPGLVAAPGLALAGVGMLVMSTWGPGSLAQVWATVVLAAVGLGIGLSIAPINDAALDDAPADAHGIAAALVVVSRMVGMVVGLGLLTAIGLNRFYATVQALENPTVQQVKDAGVVQVQTVFLGAAIAALVAAAASLLLGRQRVAHHTALD